MLLYYNGSHPLITGKSCSVDNISFPGVTLVLEPQDIGLATGVMGSIRALGGAVAQALYVSVLTNKLNDYIPAYVAPAATEAGLPQSSLTQLFAGITAGSFVDVPGITDSIIAAVADALKLAYTEAFKIVFCKYPSRRASLLFPLRTPPANVCQLTRLYYSVLGAAYHFSHLCAEHGEIPWQQRRKEAPNRSYCSEGGGGEGDQDSRSLMLYRVADRMRVQKCCT